MSSKRYRAPIDPLHSSYTHGTTPTLETVTGRLRRIVASGPVLKQALAKSIADAAIAKASAESAAVDCP